MTKNEITKQMLEVLLELLEDIGANLSAGENFYPELISRVKRELSEQEK